MEASEQLARNTPAAKFKRAGACIGFPVERRVLSYQVVRRASLQDMCILCQQGSGYLTFEEVHREAPALGGTALEN